MKKPYVIIHTLTLLDGNINSIDLPPFRTAALQYEEIALHPATQVLNIQGYLNGRVTTDDNTTHYRQPDINANAATVPKGDFIANSKAPMYYISIDPTGRLGWQDNYVDYANVDAHVISVLTEKASNGYKDMLRRLNISYIIAGENELDNKLVLHKLATLFGLERLMIGGGGVLNWSYLQQGLVDEVSVLISPVADGSTDSPRLFTAKEPFSKKQPFSFTLLEVKTLADSNIWLRYRVNKGASE